MTATHVFSAWIEQEECDRLIQAAPEDVDAGSIIDHETVQAWAESLSAPQPLPLPNYSP
ncbi:CopG family transcriptional regulator [Alcaligenes aquatilis]|uniref:CopG family transcriptional regulator n=1 Tax=Alcaligenes aquatilis TaxID=323284 RepID=A0A3G2HQM0_9BURK|nr:CopG family transcriptional regulator [Alcaligenes aquatilis]AYN19420.1 CopG family transcriptional regulator [Alcaligenes aquatilis]